MFFIVAVQVVLVVLIALFAYHAGYQVIDWKLIPLLFVCDFIVADIMMYRYLVKRRELKRKQLLMQRKQLREKKLLLSKIRQPLPL